MLFMLFGFLILFNGYFYGKLVLVSIYIRKGEGKFNYLFYFFSVVCLCGLVDFDRLVRV